MIQVRFKKCMSIRKLTFSYLTSLLLGHVHLEFTLVLKFLPFKTDIIFLELMAGYLVSYSFL